MGGHALARGTARVRRRRAARATGSPPPGSPSSPAAGPGAMEAANLGAFAPDEAALEDAAATGWPRCPSFVPDIGAVGDGRPGRARRPRPGRSPQARVTQHRHPDVVLRARAAQRVLQRHRQVLLQRAARGRPARPVDRRARRARGRGRHRAGDLPGGHAALLLARGCRPAGRRARRARALDADGAGVAGADRAGVRAGDGRAPAPGRLGRRGGRARARRAPRVGCRARRAPHPTRFPDTITG